jgi:hypothetical protein
VKQEKKKEENDFLGKAAFVIKNICMFESRFGPARGVRF